MNKILAIAAVLTAAFTISANAEINPTSLNDADKERIVKIWPEKTSGTYKFQHWIKINDAIYSIPLANYRKECNSRKTCKKHFLNEIQGQIAANIEENQTYFQKAVKMHADLVESGIPSLTADIFVTNTYPKIMIVGNKLQLKTAEVSFEVDLLASAFLEDDLEGECIAGCN